MKDTNNESKKDNSINERKKNKTKGLFIKTTETYYKECISGACDSPIVDIAKLPNTSVSIEYTAQGNNKGDEKPRLKYKIVKEQLFMNGRLITPGSSVSEPSSPIEDSQVTYGKK